MSECAANKSPAANVALKYSRNYQLTPLINIHGMVFKTRYTFYPWKFCADFQLYGTNLAQLLHVRYFVVHSIDSLSYSPQMAPQSGTCTQHDYQVLRIKIDVLSFEPLILITRA